MGAPPKPGSGAPRVSLRTEFCKHGGTTRYDAMGQMTETAATSLAGRGEKKEGARGQGLGGYLLLLGVARLTASWAVAEAGLRALSDDDYARVSIAQRFALDPKLDPSGTSWLPFPFWVTGTAMKLLDPSLDVARLTAAALAIGATWLIFAAARIWGMGDRRAFAAALGATVLPVVAALGGVMVPELPTAALAAFAVVAVTAPADEVSHARRHASLLAGAAMLAATLSRYETWPLAVFVAVYTAHRRPDPILWRRIAASVLPMVGPVSWIVHNRLAHGDALSFLRRVSSYRAALGPGARGVESLGYLVGLAVGCPAILLAFVGLVVVGFRGGNRADIAARLLRMRPWGVAGLLLFAFLVIGQLMGGAPTHHPERALLVVWLLATLAIFDLAKVVKAPSWLTFAALTLLAADYHFALADHGVDRRSEEAIGTQLRSLVPKGERVHVATNDYGYFAILAAFARPPDAVVDQTHDPRIPNEPSLLKDHWNAPDRMRSENTRWLVAPTGIVFPMTLRHRTRDGQLAVYELVPTP
jgi:Dolichyl-phosphate-mannose-protein mannosyltransferase